LVLLSFASIFIGYFFKDIFSGLGSSFWGNSIFISPSHLSNVDAEFLPFYIKLIPVIFSLFGAFFSYFFYLFYYTKINQINFNFYTFFIYLYRFFNKKWYFDVIYNYFFVKKILNFGYYISFKLFDRGFIEYFGPFGLTSLINFYSSNIGSLQTGFIYHYVSFMLFGFLFFIMFFVSYFDYFFYFSFDFYFVFVFSLFFSLSSYYNVKQFSNLKS
jgi:NADH-ubiquinone oxidoreductase chain 5